VLRYDPEPSGCAGDDVTAEERLLELGYDAGRADGILGRRPRSGCGPSSATTA
jgi:N-acetylmuramoyl-L-alanine amidase